MKTNPHGQPIGAPVTGWQAPAFPTPRVLSGYGCRLEPLDWLHHGATLWPALQSAGDALWTYLPIGAFDTAEALRSALAKLGASGDPQFYAIVDDTTGEALGFASYLRIDPEAGSIEVGWLCYSPRLQRTALATAAMYLLMRNAFALGYRRYEWKCDALNAPSRRAAERLGFRFEGIFRQARVMKGRNRDTAWFSVIDGEWPALQAAFEQWLAPGNFDDEGRQRQALNKAGVPVEPAKCSATTTVV
ncbi:GNAT family N-acetyltransferase [Chitinolyticbacter albus]|uniref:GNAT family N-acetyltransferase n=1 Tax=Chitinolyticbacter albus TaxID=2961951 RepID=UPI00210C2D5E|nr:GNAT family protein [Chitinolyticbacter albus]